jgi:regulator of cell morphogenesis and NO signaling
MTITETTTVGEIASALPASVRLFQRHGIDFCCGGKTALRIACGERGISFPALVSAIEASTSQPSKERDWTSEPLGRVVDHIVRTYHNPLREELPRLVAMASKVSGAHGAKASYLAQVEATLAELSAELQTHMRKEELVLFPAIQAIEAGSAASGPISAPIAVMEHEHDHAAVLLSELRTLTQGYTLPDWACQTFRALYQGLAELESTMHVHVHLENNVLFPRAIGMTAVDCLSERER